MNTFWGVANAGIGLLGYMGAQRNLGKQLTAAESLKAQRDIEKTFLIKPETVAASSVHDYVAPWGPKVIDNLGKIIPVFKDLFSQLQSFFETLGHKITT